MIETFLTTTDKHLRIICKGVNEGVIFNECFSQEFSSSSSILQEVKRQTSMQDPILRYLAIQSYHLFESLQNIDEFDLETIVTKSREYRAILTECEDQIVHEIQIMDNNLTNDEEKYNFATTYCNIIRDYQMLWYLAEIFFIKVSSGGYLIQDLQGWFNLQQPNVSFGYNKLMDKYNLSNGDIELESEDMYWSTVFSLAMQGRKAELLNLLICHTLSNGQAMRSVRTVVELLPVFSEEFVKCPSEFDIIWKKWHKLAENHLIDSCLLQPYPNLVVLADILLGNKEAFFSRTVIDLVDGSWYYAIVPYLLYSKPLVNVHEVCNCFKDFKRSFQKAITHFDDVATDVCSEPILQAVSATFNLDVGEFIGVISKNTNDWWLPAHLVDIIAKINPHLFPEVLNPVCGLECLGDNITKDVSTLKEFFVLKYASGLTSHHGMTLMALNYMNYCPVSGPDTIRNILRGLYLPTDRFAAMIHSWCVRYKYDDVASTICKRQAMAAYKHSNLGNSLMWSLRGGDSNFTSRIADRLIRTIFSSDINDEQGFDILDCVKNINIGLCGKKMTFVVKYYEMRRLISESKYVEAAVCLVKLLEAQLLSSHYNMSVLRSVRPLLEVGGIFRATDIVLLMDVLESVSEEDNVGTKEGDELRLLLAEELSHACLSV